MKEVLSIKVSAEEKARLRNVAAERRVSIAALLREGLEMAISTKPVTGVEPSCYDLTARYFEQPGHLGESKLGDLSSNKDHLRDFGKDNTGR